MEASHFHRALQTRPSNLSSCCAANRRVAKQHCDWEQVKDMTDDKNVTAALELVNFQQQVEEPLDSPVPFYDANDLGADYERESPMSVQEEEPSNEGQMEVDEGVENRSNSDDDLFHNMQCFIDSLLEPKEQWGNNYSAPFGLDKNLDDRHWRLQDHAAKMAATSIPGYEYSMAGDFPQWAHVDYKALLRWILDRRDNIEKADTIYLQLDNRKLNGVDGVFPCPSFFAAYTPWIHARCSMVGPLGEKTASFFLPISIETGLSHVHYTWAGPLALEVLVFLFPAINWILIDTDCVPTSLFEVDELVKISMSQSDWENLPDREDSYILKQKASAVLLFTEYQAEYNAGLVIIAAGERARNQGLDKSPEQLIQELHLSRVSFIKTSKYPADATDAVMSGFLTSPLLGCSAKTPLQWVHAWAIIGLFMSNCAFPVPTKIEKGMPAWPRCGHAIGVTENMERRIPPFTTWARPILEQGALPVLAVMQSDFPIISLPGDQIFQSRKVDPKRINPPIVHAFGTSKAEMGDHLVKLASKYSVPLLIESLLGNHEADPLWCHEDGANFIRGILFRVRGCPEKPSKATVALIRSTWQQVEPMSITSPVWDARNYDIDLSDLYGAHLTHTLTDREWRTVDQCTGHGLSQVTEALPKTPTPIPEEQHRAWKELLFSLSFATESMEVDDLSIHCPGLGGGSIGQEEEWNVNISCSRTHCRPPVYGATLATQDKWDLKYTQLGRTSHIHEFQMALFALLPLIPMWAKVLGYVGDPTPRVKTWMKRALDTISRAEVMPAHAREPHPSWIDSCRLLLVCMQSRPWEKLMSRVFTGPKNSKDRGQLVIIKGHSAGSLTGLALEKLFFAEQWYRCTGHTTVNGLACPFSLLHQKRLGDRKLHIIHFLEDKLCIWRPTPKDIGVLRDNHRVAITVITGNPS